MHEVTTSRGKAEVAGALAPNFDRNFIGHLVSILTPAGFGNLSRAILVAAVEVDGGRDDREELDALIGLGIEVMSRGERSFHSARLAGQGGSAKTIRVGNGRYGRGEPGDSPAKPRL